MFKKFRIEFYKTKGAGGSTAVYKLYKKTDILVSDRFPKQVSRFYYSDGGVTLNYRQCFYIN